MNRKNLQIFTISIWLIGFLGCLSIPISYDIKKGAGYVVDENTQQKLQEYAAIDNVTQSKIADMVSSKIYRFSSIATLEAEFTECFTNPPCKDRLLDSLYEKRPFGQMLSFVVEVYTPWLLVMITTFFALTQNERLDEEVIDRQRAYLSFVISGLFQLGVILYLFNICFINKAYFSYEETTSSAFFVVIASIVGTVVNFVFPRVAEKTSTNQ